MRRYPGVDRPIRLVFEALTLMISVQTDMAG
jgi:hypothetical protein